MYSKASKCSMLMLPGCEGQCRQAKDNTYFGIHFNLLIIKFTMII